MILEKVALTTLVRPDNKKYKEIVTQDNITASGKYLLHAEVLIKLSVITNNKKLR